MGSCTRDLGGNCEPLIFSVSSLLIVLQSHVSEIEAFRLQSTPRAGVPATNRPRISNDGWALFLDASRVDVIDQFYLDFTIDNVWDAGGPIKSLDIILTTLVKHFRKLTLTALSRLLFSLDT
jgi:hypothetical protein